MSETSLINTQDCGVSKYATDDALSSVTRASGFLPRIQLCGSSSNEAKEGRVGMGHFAMVRNKKSLIDLGNEFVCVLVSWRPKAMRFNSDPLVSYYNHLSPEFKAIVEQSAQADAGCGYGPEFLLWLPEQGEFVTYFMSNKTARTEAAVVKQYMGRACVFKSSLIKTKKYSWHGPVCSEYTSPISAMPDEVTVKEIVNAFNNPVESDVETAEKSTSGRAH
jgi:hypothetical protein